MVSHRITLLIHSLRGGGAERQMAMLASSLAEAGHHCTLLTLDCQPTVEPWTQGAPKSEFTPTSFPDYPLSNLVHRKQLNLLSHSPTWVQGILANWHRIRALRNEFEIASPQVIISFTDRMNILALAAGRKLGVPIVICERSDPRKQNLGRFWEYWRRRLYPSCALSVSQTPSVERYLFSLTRGKPTRIIPSAIDPPSKLSSRLPLDQQRRSLPSKKKHLLAIGRFSEEKGFARLIEAWKLCAGQLPDWQLSLVGQGTQEKALKNQVHELRLESRVDWPGWQSDIWSTLCEGDAFVLPSHYEGFPQTLLQAMACGLPSIAMNCSDAIEQVIRHDVDGWIVNPASSEELAKSLLQVLADPNRLQRYSENCIPRVQPYTWDAIKNEWLTMIESIP